MSETIAIVISMVVFSALVIGEFWFDHVIKRAFFKLVDRLPPFRPNGSYRSQSMPEKYDAVRKKRNGS